MPSSEGTRNATAHGAISDARAAGLWTISSPQTTAVAPDVRVWKSSHSETPKTNCTHTHMHIQSHA